MPTITLDGPPVKDVDKKRAAASEITEAAAKLYGLAAQAIVVVFRENQSENVAVGGQLVCDRQR